MIMTKKYNPKKKKRAERRYRMFVGDFETTVKENTVLQDETEVWASGLAELYTDFSMIDNCIEDTYAFLMNELYYQNVIVYYHNLKFDGAFWVDFLMRKLGLTIATYKDGTGTHMCDKKDMENNSFTCAISEMGQWYNVVIKMHGRTLEIRDSLKLIPCSVEQMGKAYATKHRKLTMDYISDKRRAGGEITEEEKRYLVNDLLVVKEVLQIMFSEGHNKLTIGSCCLSEYKQMISRDEYNDLFPDQTLAECHLGNGLYPNMDEYVRKSYKGGWCYLKRGKESTVIENGQTADVNSLYPSVMHSDSGNVYPRGNGHEWEGNFIPEQAKKKNRFYFVRIRTKFNLKPGYLPTIQVKGNYLYRPNEWLETSDVVDKETGEYTDKIRYSDGTERDTALVLTLTGVDLELFLEHYDTRVFEILDGIWYYAETGFFDDYIDKYKKIKESEKGAKRTIAKLYLNNLYGKMAASRDSSFKVPVLENKDEKLHFITIAEKEKMPGYIPVGSAVTSYARAFTIRAAQKNYEKFIYADTDSIHCQISNGPIEGITVHDSNFGCWKLESTWDKGFFVRQKTYMEHVVEENQVQVEKPYYDIKCAGMPKRCKQLLNASITGDRSGIEKITPEENDFMNVKRSMEDFTYGLVVPSKLMPRRVKGGIVLTPTTFCMK